MDDRMKELAIWLLDELEMKKPVDDILWQRTGYTKEERLYILGKLVGLGYLWLQLVQERVYAVRSYITDNLLSEAEKLSRKRRQMQT